MRTFIISDIHGNNELFRKSLKEVGLKKSDRLILLGDLIDRGEDSKGVLDTVILLLNSGFNIDCIMGNHEQMFLEARYNHSSFNQWLINGGDKTLLSFLTRSVEKIPRMYFDLISSFKYFVSTEQCIFVHAALNMKLQDPFTDTNTLLWERNPEKFLDENWLGDRKLIHGHSPQTQKEILDSLIANSKIICIDNGTYINKDGYGSLCIFQLENSKIQFIQ